MRGRIQIRYQHEGRRYSDTLQLSWSDSNVEEALRIRGERLARIKAGRPPMPAERPKPLPKPLGWVRRTFAEVAQEYLDHVLEADEDDDFRLKRSTRASNKNLLNRHWLAELGAEPIDTLTLNDLKNAARQKWPSRKTKTNAYSALRQVFAYAAHEDREYIIDDPSALLKIATRRRRQKPEPDPYSAQDRDTLLDWLKENTPQHVYAYFLVAFYSGMRTGELLALRWEDYDGEQFHVRRARVRSELTSTKTDESRHVWIPKHICREINTLPSRFKREWVFLNQLGNPYLKGRHLNEHFERAHAKTGVRRSKQPNYPWRHTYASLGLTAGGQPALLAKQLGHTLAVFHSTYAKWIDTDKDRDAIEAAFGEQVGAKMGANDPAVGGEPQ